MWKKGERNMIDIVCFGGNFAYRACSGMGYSGVFPDEMEETEETEVQMSMIRKMKQKQS